MEPTHLHVNVLKDSRAHFVKQVSILLTGFLYTNLPIFSLQISSAVSRTTGPILGLFVLS